MELFWPIASGCRNTGSSAPAAIASQPAQTGYPCSSERLNKEVKRRADVVWIFLNEASIMRLIGAVLFEQNNEWQTSSRYMMVEAFAQIDHEEVDPVLSITTKAALS